MKLERSSRKNIEQCRDVNFIWLTDMFEVPIDGWNLVQSISMSTNSSNFWFLWSNNISTRWTINWTPFLNLSNYSRKTFKVNSPSPNSIQYFQHRHRATLKFSSIKRAWNISSYFSWDSRKCIIRIFKLQKSLLQLKDGAWIVFVAFSIILMINHVAR